MPRDGEIRPAWEGQDRPLSPEAQEVHDRIMSDPAVQAQIDDMVDRAAAREIDDPRMHPDLRARLLEKIQSDPGWLEADVEYYPNIMSRAHKSNVGRSATNGFFGHSISFMPDTNRESGGH
jgi:hypothetical protein